MMVEPKLRRASRHGRICPTRRRAANQRRDGPYKESLCFAARSARGQSAIARGGRRRAHRAAELLDLALPADRTAGGILGIGVAQLRRALAGHVAVDDAAAEKRPIERAAGG